VVNGGLVAGDNGWLRNGCRNWMLGRWRLWSRRGESRGWASRLDPALEDRYVGTGGKLDANLVTVGRVVIVLSEALADFSCGDADDGVGVGIVAGRAAEDVHSDGTFFDLVGVAVESLLDYEAEESWITFALEKKRMDEQQLKLGENGGFIHLRLRSPWFEDGAARPRTGSSDSAGL